MKIYQSLEKGGDYCFVSLDATAAFDRVWHSALIYKLRRIGINGALLNGIIDYLKVRKQRIVINGQFSDFIDILCGTGSILGPLLFLIYFNDIVDELECESYVFMDDTSVCEPIKYQVESFSKINRIWLN